jgi:hypothetical protein
MTLLQDIDVDDDEVGAGRTRRARRETAGTERATRSRAAQRAIDRRRKRLDREKRTGRSVDRTPVVTSAPRETMSLRARITGIPFVVPVIALLVVGLGLSLWLSTKAAADSYRLGEERQENQALLDRRDTLKRSYESGDSAPELADKASRLGLIPAKNPARMIVDGSGRPRVVGDPEPAQGKAMRSINPSTGPDPVEKIDPKKVDDSEGLPGGSSAGSGDAQPDSSNGAQPSTPSQQAPSPAAPTTAPNTAAPNNVAPNPGSNTTTPTTPAPTAPSAGPQNPPAPTAVAPAPNVLPPSTNASAPANTNAPGVNGPQSR